MDRAAPRHLQSPTANRRANEVPMSLREDAPEQLATAVAETPGDRRRPYRAPRILSREPLESVAAVCAPAPPAKGNPGACPSGPISS
jgi:hypothetical protein